MKALLFIIITGILLACNKPRCPETVQCSMGVTFYSIGYDSVELDSVLFVVFPADNTFTNPIDTFIALDTFVENTFVGPEYVWQKTRGVYGTGDTLACTYTIPDSLEFYNSNSGLHDWEIIIPAVNRVYKFSKITYSGSDDQTMSGCDAKGSPINPSCNRYISSYELNGIKINFAANSNTAVLYINK